ncbi:hypothetical protein HID58_021741, partial [Brassica napus]
AVCNSQDQESLLWFSGNVSSSVSPLNWNLSIDCCSWEGIKCDDTSESDVTAISLPLRRLSGNLSWSVQNLHRLSHLDLSHNLLSGPLPPGFFSALDHLMIYNLSELEQLFLPANHLTGKIDNSITRLKKLTLLELYSNHLEGEIPKDIGHLSSLQSLQLHVNNITGTVPLSLTNCTKLVKLNLRINRLLGNLTELEFSQLKSLRILDLGNNSFTGDVPEKVFSCKSLKAIRFAGNKLTGQISPRVKELESLTFLAFSDNILTNVTGALSILQRCRKLSILMLARNFYDETFPSNLKSLELMDLSQNRLVGSIPSREPATTSEDDELKRTLVAGSAIGYLFGFSSILFVRAWRV